MHTFSFISIILFSARG